MISFELTEEQIELQKKMRSLALERLRPLSFEVDRKQAGSIDDAHRRIIGDNILNSFLIPKAYGGLQLSWTGLALVMEELGYGDSSFAGIFAQTLHAVSTLIIGGSETQKAHFLPSLMDGTGAAAGFAATEEKSGSDTSSFATTARREGKSFSLNGSKNPIINTGYSLFYVLWASMAGDASRAGINAFIIPGDAPGLTFSPYHDKFGIRGTPTATLFLKDVVIPEENLIGLPGSGYFLLMQAVDWGRAFIGAIGIGLARAALEEAVSFAKNRIIFNRPIITKEGISFTLAELATELEAARLLVWRACRLMERDLDYTVASSMAKLYASELALRTANEGMLILGQQGYTRPSPMQKYLRDAHVLRIIEGTSHIQKCIIANQL